MDVALSEVFYCHCGVEAVKRTSGTKENLGRDFWTCNKHRSDRCRFWYWADDPKLRDIAEETALPSNNSSVSSQQSATSQPATQPMPQTPKRQSKPALNPSSTPPSTSRKSQQTDEGRSRRLQAIQAGLASAHQQIQPPLTPPPTISAAKRKRQELSRQLFPPSVGNITSDDGDDGTILALDTPSKRPRISQKSVLESWISPPPSQGAECSYSHHKGKGRAQSDNTVVEDNPFLASQPLPDSPLQTIAPPHEDLAADLRNMAQSFATRLPSILRRFAQDLEDLRKSDEDKTRKIAELTKDNERLQALLEVARLKYQMASPNNSLSNQTRANSR